MPQKPAKAESKQDYLSRCTKELISGEGKSADQAYAMCNSYWADAHKKEAGHAALTLAAPLTLELARGGNGEPKGFMMTAYTGQVMDFGWMGRYVFDLDGMKAKAKIPILREHKRDRVVGFSTKAWVENGNFLIEGSFSGSTRDAKEVLALAEEGYPWQASVGISPKKIKYLESPKETAMVNGAEVTGPLEIWSQSTVGEVSFVSLGADSDTAAISLEQSEQAGIVFEVIQAEGEAEMTLQEFQQKHPELYQEVFGLGAASVDTDKIDTEIARRGIMAERERIVTILEADGDPTMTMQAVKDGIEAEKVGWLFFKAEKANRDKGLKTLETAQPESVGHGAKETEVSGKGDYMKLVDAYRKEKKCGLGQAMSDVAKQQPEIHQAWLGSQQ